MQVSYSFDGEPEVSVVVDIPKMRDAEIDPTVTYQTRIAFYRMMLNIGEDSKANPQAYAAKLFKTAKSELNTIVLVAVVFAIQHEKGRTVLTYTDRDVPRL